MCVISFPLPLFLCKPIDFCILCVPYSKHNSTITFRPLLELNTALYNGILVFCFKLTWARNFPISVEMIHEKFIFKKKYMDGRDEQY